MGAVVHHVVKSVLKSRALNYNPHAKSRPAEMVLDVIWCLSSAAVIFLIGCLSAESHCFFLTELWWPTNEMRVACVRWGKQRLAAVTVCRAIQIHTLVDCYDFIYLLVTIVHLHRLQRWLHCECFSVVNIIVTHYFPCSRKVDTVL